MAPGYFTTNIGRGLLIDLENEMIRQIIAEIERRTPIGKIADVEDLEAAAVYLASDASNYPTDRTTSWWTGGGFLGERCDAVGLQRR